MMLKAGGMILLAAVLTYSHNSRTIAKENITPLIFAPGYGMSALAFMLIKEMESLRSLIFFYLH